MEVAICTWNRAESLRSTLKSLRLAAVPTGWDLRVLVVDNGSKDETPSVLNELEHAGLPLVRLVEKQTGHTFARNRAIASSIGHLVIWTDDDVCVPEHWLTRYAQAFVEQPEYAFWGAAIEPVFPTGKPAWLSENWTAAAGCFAARDLGDEAIELTRGRFPYGANFALRGDVLRQFEFNTQLGRRGNLVLGEDEIDFLSRLVEHGYHGQWVPHNGVQHVISADRASERYVWQYFRGQGVRLALANDSPESRGRLWRARLWHRANYYWKRRWAPSPAWFAHLACWGLATGKAQGQTARPENK
jgi:glycosyltransferase involved in cell wall biosynthesis